MLRKKGDHEGRIREVPEEERSPSMYIAQNVCIIVRRNLTLLQALLESQLSRFTLLMYMHVLSHASKVVFLPM
jgi:hypothetical protein